MLIVQCHDMVVTAVCSYLPIPPHNSVLRAVSHIQCVLTLFALVLTVMPTSMYVSAVMMVLTLVHSSIRRGLFPISDKFRIVGLAEHAGGPQVDLLSDPEFVSMFLFHNVKPLDKEGEGEVILNKVLYVCWQ